MEKPTLLGIPVLAYLDVPRINALLGEVGEVDIIEGPAGVRQYSWRDGQIAVVTHKDSDGAEVMLGVRTRLVGTSSDRGLEVGSAAGQVDELYGDAKPHGNGTVVVEYPEGTCLVVQTVDGTVTEMQILSPSLRESAA